MSKDWCRDYATAAFRLWKMNGQQTRSEIEDRIRNGYIRNNPGDPQVVNIKAQAEVDKRFAELNDIDACAETFRLLRESGKDYVCKAVEDVYMYDAQRDLHRGEITRRVIRVAVTLPASEREVYRWLAEARTLFSALRGLRIE